MAERRFRLLFSFSAAVLVATSLAVPAIDRPAVAAPAATPDCKLEQPNEVMAGRVAAACHRRVEILGERTEVSQTFVNGDGSQTLEVGIEPERVRKGANWVPVDNPAQEDRRRSRAACLGAAGDLFDGRCGAVREASRRR